MGSGTKNSWTAESTAWGWDWRLVGRALAPHATARVQPQAPPKKGSSAFLFRSLREVT